MKPDTLAVPTSVKGDLVVVAAALEDPSVAVAVPIWTVGGGEDLYSGAGGQGAWYRGVRHDVKTITVSYAPVKHNRELFFTRLPPALGAWKINEEKC